MYETLEHWKQYKQEKALQAKIAKDFKLFVVITAHTQQIMFSHKSKNECYEWIFKTVNYA